MFLALKRTVLTTSAVRTSALVMMYIILAASIFSPISVSAADSKTDIVTQTLKTEKRVPKVSRASFDKRTGPAAVSATTAADKAEFIRLGGQTRLMNERRTASLLCQISAFFSVDEGDATTPHTVLEGKGLMNCHNDQGFTVEMPVTADLSVEFPHGFQQNGEFALSANSAEFVVSRDISQAQDKFAVRKLSRVPAVLTSNHRVVFRGERHDLVIEINLNSPQHSLQGVKVTGLVLHFDDSAPDFQ